VTVLLGTSGWQYADWKPAYYGRTPQRRWFEHVVADFRTVELNVTFYRLPKAETFAGWRDRSPDDTVLTVKASRYITHIKRLRDTASSVAMLMDRVEPLGTKLGPVLLQLPPNLERDVEGLVTTMNEFPSRVRLAVEPRHDSWWHDDVRRALEQRNAALVWADRKGPITPLWRTADWCYIRFHEGRASPWPMYGDAALDAWAGRIHEHAGDGDTYVYFNNDPGAAALRNAVTLGRRLAARDVTVTRYPERIEPAPAAR
jgi:uncharacterized protein YecE (DUF72 family)